MTLQSLAHGITWCVFAYFSISFLSYFFLNILSVLRMQRIEAEKLLADLPQMYSGLEPPISLLLSTRNHAGSIVSSVQALLQLDYPATEIIVINDGSQDATLATLVKAFNLHVFPEAYRIRLTTQTVRCIYRSSRYPNLRVIDKEYGGQADALNAGINAARFPLFCSVDDDTIFQTDSLRHLAAPFLSDSLVIATTAAVRVANGGEIKNGLLSQVALPQNWLARFQIIEYLHTAFLAPLGWSTLHGMLIAPAAGIGLFHKEMVLTAGGYRSDATLENRELIVRMHRLMRKKRQAYRIAFVADPVCWQRVPQELSQLQSSSMKRQQGLFDSLSKNWGLLFSRNGGVPGLIAFPFFLLFECLGPAFELFGYLFILLAYVCGFISWEVCMAFFLLAIGLGILLSLSGFLLEEISFQLFPKTSDIAKLAITAIIVNFGYRQLNMAWRSVAMLDCLIGRKPAPQK